mmetsp:Transcript_38205/g.83887  ORF Transcript_38205/g.83887 Transcript_38205/m.83887 type:complete len:82 (-) Transcript_38205:67-312(-)
MQLPPGLSPLHCLSHGRWASRLMTPPPRRWPPLQFSTAEHVKAFQPFSPFVIRAGPGRGQGQADGYHSNFLLATVPLHATF